MKKQGLIELVINISATDASADDIDQMTRQLLQELKQAEVESVDLVSGGVAPYGTKSADPASIGSIAVSVLPAVAPIVIEMIKGWSARGNGRTVKFKGKVRGQSIEFEGNAKDLENLLTNLGKKAKK